MSEPTVIYCSCIDYSAFMPEWFEAGQLPDCVDTRQIGKFVCRCGQHQVNAEMSADPIDGGARIARLVRVINARTKGS